MTELDRAAQNALVSVAAFVSLSNLSDNDLELWLGHLRAVLLDCKRCAHSLSAVQNTAHALCGSTPGRRNGALRDLHIAVRDYYGLQAGARVDAFRAQAKAAA